MNGDEWLTLARRLRAVIFVWLALLAAIPLVLLLAPLVGDA
jgi:hypothetical protein